MRPTRRTLALALAGLAPALAPVVGGGRLWPLPVVWLAALVAAVAADAVLAPATRFGRSRLDWRLEAPPVVAMGEPGRAVVSVRLVPPPRRPRPVVALLDTDELLAPTGVVVGRLPADGGAAELALPLVARRRGRSELERLWLRVPGPLGLVERVLALPLERTVEARPDLARVKRVALAFADRRSFLAGLKIERYAGDGTEFEALREFVPGADPRSIDWKASARHRHLLSREFRAERNHQVVVAIDTGRLMAEPLAAGPAADRRSVGPPALAGRRGRAALPAPAPHEQDAAPAPPVPRLDHAIHAALLLAYVATATGDRVGLYAFDERPRRLIEPRGGVVGFRALHAAVAELDYGAAETNFTLGLTELAGRLRRRSLVVVLTEFVDSTTARLMMENVERLARRHLVVFVALRDPLLDRLTTAPPAAFADVERAVVAAALAAEREAVLGRLARAGVAALDAAPAQAEPRLVARYLEIKRRERI